MDLGLAGTVRDGAVAFRRRRTAKQTDLEHLKELHPIYNRGEQSRDRSVRTLWGPRESWVEPVQSTIRSFPTAGIAETVGPRLRELLLSLTFCLFDLGRRNVWFEIPSSLLLLLFPRQIVDHDFHLVDHAQASFIPCLTHVALAEELNPLF